MTQTPAPHRPTTDAGPAASTNSAAHFENLRVKGDALTAKVRGLLHEGNVQRVVVRNSDGHAVIEIPVNAGLVAAAVAPVLTGVAAIAALAADWQIDIHRAAEPFAG